MKDAIILLLALLLLTSCLKEDELKKPFVTYDPIQLDDGWEISMPQVEGIDPDKLSDIYKEFHSDMSIWQVRSLLVFRNGKLVAESYTKDDSDRLTPRAIWSCTKQVMGLLAGIAIDKGLINEINDPISDYLPEVQIYPEKKDIRIQHLLTMKSGIAYSNDGLGGQTDDILRQLPAGITGFILSLPLDHAPGEHLKYKDGDPQLLSAVLQAQAGKATSGWAQEVLFEPMGIKNIQWNNYKDGTTLGGFGILTTPRELAKFGQLVLNRGIWKGKELLSEQWIDNMLYPHVEELYDLQFGYLWWIDQERDMYLMSGHGGQFVCILPAKNLLIVITSEVNTQGRFQFRDGLFEWVDRIVEICN